MSAQKNAALDAERKRMAKDAVKVARGNHSAAAKLLRIARATLYRWLAL